MLLIVFKYLTTAAIIVLVSEIAKRNDKLGALVASLPIVTIMVMIWLFVEKQGAPKIAKHAYYSFWYVLPTLPMFLQLPYMLRKGFAFWPTLGVSLFLTLVSFMLIVFIARRFGVELIP